MNTPVKHRGFREMNTSVKHHGFYEQRVDRRDANITIEVVCCKCNKRIGDNELKQVSNPDLQLVLFDAQCHGDREIITVTYAALEKMLLTGQRMHRILLFQDPESDPNKLNQRGPGGVDGQPSLC